MQNEKTEAESIPSNLGTGPMTGKSNIILPEIPPEKNPVPSENPVTEMIKKINRSKQSGLTFKRTKQGGAYGAGRKHNGVRGWKRTEKVNKK